MNIPFGVIKDNCEEVTLYTYQLSGFGGNIYGTGNTDRCGFYTEKSCNSKNCPLFNLKKGYKGSIEKIKSKINQSKKA